MGYSGQLLVFCIILDAFSMALFEAIGIDILSNVFNVNYVCISGSALFSASLFQQMFQQRFQQNTSPYLFAKTVYKLTKNQNHHYLSVSIWC